MVPGSCFEPQPPPVSILGSWDVYQNLFYMVLMYCQCQLSQNTVSVFMVLMLCQCQLSQDTAGVFMVLMSDVFWMEVRCDH